MKEPIILMPGNKDAILKITKKGNIKLITKHKKKLIGYEDILIANIDSPNKKNSIKCKCNEDRAFLLSTGKKKYYYCLSCSRLYRR